MESSIWGVNRDCMSSLPVATVGKFPKNLLNLNYEFAHAGNSLRCQRLLCKKTVYHPIAPKTAYACACHQKCVMRTLRCVTVNTLNASS